MQFFTNRYKFKVSTSALQNTLRLSLSYLSTTILISYLEILLFTFNLTKTISFQHRPVIQCSVVFRDKKQQFVNPGSNPISILCNFNKIGERLTNINILVLKFPITLRRALGVSQIHRRLAK